MKLKEAYQIMELEETASPEEAKKQYRKLSKQYHPDVNKEPDAENKFKQINEAYECVKNGKGNERQDFAPTGWHRNPFGHVQRMVPLENVEVNLSIDFKEAVLGCKKDIKYFRQTKCTTCNGGGQTHLNNGCTHCGGKGQTVVKQRGMVFISTCPHCAGKGNTIDCKGCTGSGVLSAEVSVNVSVPAGIIHGSTLRLQGMGNYAGSVMGIMDQHTDVFCHVSVVSDPDLTLEGRSVVSTISLSLLDAIRGCKRNVRTIHGEREIEVPPSSRNSDEVIIPLCGVGGTGDQRVLLDVRYPKDMEKLVSTLLSLNEG